MLDVEGGTLLGLLLLLSFASSHSEEEVEGAAMDPKCDGEGVA